MEKKRAGQNTIPLPGVKRTIPTETEGKSPYFVAFVTAAEGALVLDVLPPPPLLSLQPANTPSIPSSTIRVNNLFIVGVSFTKGGKRTSKNVAEG